MMLWCESVAALGFPVVPDVNWMLIGSWMSNGALGCAEPRRRGGDGGGGGGNDDGDNVPRAGGIVRRCPDERSERADRIP